MLYYVSGDDSFNKTKYINKLSDGKEQIVINMQTVDYSELMSEMLSIDLFSQPKIYILEGFKGFSNKSEKYSKTNLALLNQIFTSDQEIVISSDKAINRSTSFYEKYGSGIEVKEYVLQDLDFDSSLELFITEENINITADALDLLKSNFPNNIFGATNDLLKIWEYTNHNQIGIDDVNSAGQKLTEHKIFDLYNMIIVGKTKQAIEYLNIIRNEGISDSDILLVSFTQIKRMYETKILISKGYNDFKIASQIGSNPYATKQNRKTLSQVSEKRLEKYVLALADFDYQFKSGKNTPTNLVDLLVVM